MDEPKPPLTVAEATRRWKAKNREKVLAQKKRWRERRKAAAQTPTIPQEFPDALQ